MAHVLIAGCGYVGTALGTRLAAEGHVVWGLRRDPRALPSVIRAVEADLRVPNTLRNLPRVDYVFHLVSPERPDEDAAQAARVEGLRYLLAALAFGRQRVKRLFLASCLDVYGDREGAWVDEDSELTPTPAAGRSLYDARGRGADAPVPTTVVRLGEVYGPGRLGMLEPVLAQSAVRVARPTEHVNLVHRDDAAGALAHLLGLRAPASTYLVVDREPIPRVTVVEWLATRLGRPAPPLAPRSGAPADIRAMSERLVESGYAFRYPTFKQGYEPIVSRL